MAALPSIMLDRAPDALLRGVLRFGGFLDLLVSGRQRKTIQLELDKRRYKAADLVADNNIIAAYEARRFMPDTLLLQISRRCNLKCSMCGWSVWGRNKGFMSLELYKHVLSEAKSNGIKTIGLSNPQGEPLLSPHAGECIMLALEEGFNVALNTNCTPLGPRNIQVIAEAAKNDRFSIQASFSGYDKASHEEVYVGSKFEDTSRKIRELNAALKAIRRESALTVNGITMDPATTEKHIAYLGSLGIGRARITIHHPDNFAGIVDIGTNDNALGISSFKKDLDVRSLRLCSMIVTQMLVYDDGKVSACACRDSEGVMEIGDLSKESLADIRQGPAFRGMIKAFMDRNLTNMPLCQKCDIPYGDSYYPLLHYYTDEPIANA